MNPTGTLSLELREHTPDPVKWPKQVDLLGRWPRGDQRSQRSQRRDEWRLGPSAVFPAYSFLPWEGRDSTSDRNQGSRDTSRLMPNSPDRLGVLAGLFTENAKVRG